MNGDDGKSREGKTWRRAMQKSTEQEHMWAGQGEETGQEQEGKEKPRREKGEAKRKRERAEESTQEMPF